MSNPRKSKDIETWDKNVYLAHNKKVEFNPTKSESLNAEFCSDTNADVLKSTLEVLKIENKTLLDNIYDSEMCIRELKATNAGLEGQLEDCTTELNQFVDDLTAKNDELNEELDECSRELNIAIDKLTVENKELQSQLSHEEELQATIEDLSMENDDLKLEVDEITQQNYLHEVASIHQNVIVNTVTSKLYETKLLQKTFNVWLKDSMVSHYNHYENEKISQVINKYLNKLLKAKIFSIWCRYAVTNTKEKLFYISHKVKESITTPHTRDLLYSSHSSHTMNNRYLKNDVYMPMESFNISPIRTNDEILYNDHRTYMNDMNTNMNMNHNGRNSCNGMNNSNSHIPSTFDSPTSMQYASRGVDVAMKYPNRLPSKGYTTNGTGGGEGMPGGGAFSCSHHQHHQQDIALRAAMTQLFNMAFHADTYISTIISTYLKFTESCQITDGHNRFQSNDSLQRILSGKLKYFQYSLVMEKLMNEPGIQQGYISYCTLSNMYIHTSNSNTAKMNISEICQVMSTQISNVLCYTLVISVKEYTAVILQFREYMRQSNKYVITQERNHWHSGNISCHVVDIFQCLTTHCKFEVHYFTPQSWEISKKVHLQMQQLCWSKSYIEECHLIQERNVTMQALQYPPDLSHFNPPQMFLDMSTLGVYAEAIYRNNVLIVDGVKQYLQSRVELYFGKHGTVEYHLCDPSVIQTGNS